MEESKVEERKWFDVNNIDHIVAYNHLCNTGTWPKGFIKDYMGLTPMWRSIIASMMAEEWIKHAMAGHIPGIPAYCGN